MKIILPLNDLKDQKIVEKGHSTVTLNEHSLNHSYNFFSKERPDALDAVGTEHEERLRDSEYDIKKSYIIGVELYWSEANKLWCIQVPVVTLGGEIFFQFENRKEAKTVRDIIRAWLLEDNYQDFLKKASIYEPARTTS